CPSCGAPATGRFCSSCGTALAGATCATCSAALTPGARFCHRCGTPAGATAAAPSRGFANALPWAVAALALVSLTALVVGQRFGARGNATTATTDVLDGANMQGSTPISALPQQGGGPAGAQPRAPDISQMTPEQRAERLYDRIMTEHEAGRPEAVRTFLPMARAAYEMIEPLNLDQRYDLGRLGEVGGDLPLARAEADTILATRPTHLLGLILAARVARLEKDDARARALDARLIASESKERSTALPEYLLHKNDIDAALAAARPTPK
ncbi:MAG: zinc ribbon domain-containing protein, partial [Gemmatimonadaceae bacterium]